jgi:hypothetical protein
VSSASEQVSRLRGVSSVRREVWSRRGILSYGAKIGKDLLDFFSTFPVICVFFELLVFGGSVCHVIVFEIVFVVVVVHVIIFGGVECGDLTKGLRFASVASHDFQVVVFDDGEALTLWIIGLDVVRH